MIELQFQGDGMSWDRDIYCDRMAMDGTGSMLFASIITDAMQFKAIRGALCTNKAMTMTAPDLLVGLPGSTPRKPNFINKFEGGYTFHVHKLPYRKVHAFAVAKQPGLMMAATESHLWRELSGPTFTTPILRQWMPAVVEELVREELLVHAYGFNCNVASLLALSAGLDDVVSDLLRMGKIEIPAKSA